MLTLILFSLFSDHMVLQRGHENAIWGKDRPQQAITLTVEGANPAPVAVTTVSGADGAWRLNCPILPAGGPYRLHIQGSSEKVIDDVLVGDVWLASGQSNMEFPLERARGAEAEIASANFPAIRVAKIPQTTAQSPQDSVPTSWQVCSPSTASPFTAVGYFFAKDLQKHLGIPIGIIDSTWGGTRVEAWTSREALRPVMPEMDAELGQLVTSEAGLAKLRAEYAAWMSAWERKSFPQDTGIAPASVAWEKADFNDGAWRTMPAPGSMQSHGFKANGAVWFRRTVEVPAGLAGRGLMLNLGAIDDFDDTFFNGELVGRTREDTLDAYRIPRHYAVPGRLVHAGANTIAVRVFDRYGDGGLMGPSGAMFLESNAAPEAKIALTGTWHWEVEREIPLVPGSVYANAPQPPPGLAMPNSATALYNGMIAPLIPYGLKGFIWYQGEANVAAHATYRDRFTAMIRDWRSRWGQGTLPFYFVQLASFTESPGWPYLREAQTQTLAEPGTGMAVIIDIGEEHDIHPKNKSDVGLRLALLARAKTYGEKNLAASGPTLERVEISGGTARVHWHHAGGLRTHDNSAAVLGLALAGSDGVYHAADARIDGNTIVVTSKSVVAPRNVRYAWTDWPEVNLENEAGLPAAPFRTDGF